jgi:5-bromo-4-chloroindolyl phosphate hydrolysis protein
MKTFSLLLFFFTNITCKENTTVYICNSPGAKKYHYTSSCRGLSNCTYKIIKVDIEKAKKDGKTLCGWEK